MTERGATVPATVVGLGEFVTEQYLFAWPAVRETMEAVGPLESTNDRAVRARFAAVLEQRLIALAPRGLGETTPGVAAGERFARAVADVVAACDGFLRRAALRASLTPDERREILRGMVLTRATDNRLKTFFRAARCGTATRRSRARASDRSGRKRSTPRRSACAAAIAYRDRRRPGRATSSRR